MIFYEVEDEDEDTHKEWIPLNLDDTLNLSLSAQRIIPWAPSNETLKELDPAILEHFKEETFQTHCVPMGQPVSKGGLTNLSLLALIESRIIARCIEEGALRAFYVDAFSLTVEQLRSTKRIFMKEGRKKNCCIAFVSALISWKVTGSAELDQRWLQNFAINGDDNIIIDTVLVSDLYCWSLERRKQVIESRKAAASTRIVGFCQTYGFPPLRALLNVVGKENFTYDGQGPLWEINSPNECQIVIDSLNPKLFSRAVKGGGQDGDETFLGRSSRLQKQIYYNQTTSNRPLALWAYMQTDKNKHYQAMGRWAPMPTHLGGLALPVGSTDDSWYDGLPGTFKSIVHRLQSTEGTDRTVVVDTCTNVRSTKDRTAGLEMIERAAVHGFNVETYPEASARQEASDTISEVSGKPPSHSDIQSRMKKDFVRIELLQQFIDKSENQAEIYKKGVSSTTPELSLAYKRMGKLARVGAMNPLTSLNPLKGLKDWFGNSSSHHKLYVKRSDVTNIVGSCSNFLPTSVFVKPHMRCHQDSLKRRGCADLHSSTFERDSEEDSPSDDSSSQDSL